jgi:hypothetical protein
MRGLGQNIEYVSESQVMKDYLQRLWAPVSTARSSQPAELSAPQSHDFAEDSENEGRWCQMGLNGIRITCSI